MGKISRRRDVDPSRKVSRRENEAEREKRLAELVDLQLWIR